MIRKQVAVVVTCAMSAAASAGIVSSSPHAHGGGRVYEGDQFRFRPSFFDIFVEDPEWTWGGTPSVPPPPGVVDVKTRPVQLQHRISLNGLPPGEPVLDFAISSFFDVFVEIAPDGSRVFDTEMLQLDLQGSHPTLGNYRLRESPTLPSRGRYHVQDLPGGLYHIDSFFDIFTELSLDDGQTWIPSMGSTRFTLVPTPGATGLLAAAGLAALRRRRR